MRDTGRGVEPELLPHIFDRFVTGDDSRGSGLGLAIAREYANAHGGRIELRQRSDGKRGAWFRLSLPLAQGALPLMDALKTPTFAGIK